MQLPTKCGLSAQYCLWLVFGDDFLIGSTNTDLLQLFGSITRIISELQHRFDGLPIHRIVYYQSYHQGVLQDLISASKLDPTGSNQHDCLGMTPLHILACSSVHDLEMYRLIVEKYPENLITEDRWGALPLLYAFWAAAPSEIIQFLLKSYQSLYPGHAFNWTMMVETIARCVTPKESIENLIRLKQMHFAEQPLHWDYLLDEFVNDRSHVTFGELLFQERLQFLVMCGMSSRVEALAFKVLRDCITNMIQTADYKRDEDNRPILHEIQGRIAYFEDELPRLKETTTMLELALWKMKMSGNGHSNKNQTHCQKKIKTDEASIRRQCRNTCGADIMIGLVLPFLIPT